MYKYVMFLLENSIKKANIRYTIIAGLSLITYSILRNEFNIYLILNNIITISMITVFIYVNIIRAKFVDKTFIKNLQIGYLVLIEIVGLNWIGLIFLFEYTPRIYFVFLFSVQAVLECCSVENFFVCKKSTLKSIVICIFYLILFSIWFYMFKINNNFYNEYKLYFLRGFITINVLLSIGICISVLEKIFRNKESFSVEKFRHIVFYICSILFYYIGLIGIILGYKKFSEVIILIKCIIFYNFYNYVIGKVLDNSLTKINTNIEIATKTKKELNSILIKRNKVLNEANIMLKKSREKNNQLIDSIYDGIFLFSNNKLQYFNKKTLVTLNIKNEEILNMDLSKFIKKYFDITLEDINKSGDYIPFAKMKNTNLEVEIFLICVDQYSKILYIHDMSAINENKQIKKVLEEYLVEEEIKKQFFANISHELKTPINLISSALQMNQIYLNENNLEGVNKNKRIIKQNCLRLIRTINNGASNFMVE